MTDFRHVERPSCGYFPHSIDTVVYSMYLSHTRIRLLLPNLVLASFVSVIESHPDLPFSLDPKLRTGADKIDAPPLRFRGSLPFVAIPHHRPLRFRDDRYPWPAQWGERLSPANMKDRKLFEWGGVDDGVPELSFREGLGLEDELGACLRGGGNCSRHEVGGVFVRGETDIQNIIGGGHELDDFCLLSARLICE